MRKGQNPAKFVKDVARPEWITVALLNYIPFLSGFYAETLDVLKVCMESMRKDAGLPFDLMVFDNGSCSEVREFLVKEKEEGRIQYLILSEKNMGKGGAWNVMLAGAPGEIIAYTDSDVLFSPNWLSRSVEILESFPNVGMVTARPFRTPPEFYESTLKWAREKATLEDGQFIPWETFLEFNLSLGQTEEENRKVYAETGDWRITYNPMSLRGERSPVPMNFSASRRSNLPNKETASHTVLRSAQGSALAATSDEIVAFAGASHWQFTAYKSTLQQFLPFEMDKPMGQVRQLDKRMNDAGLLRLMVSDPLAMNMSNTLGYLRGELKQAGKKKSISFGKRVLEIGFIRKILLAVYNKIFRIYYE
ncbi:MAG: glycosyltransferase family 2 protein [Chloroflexota bacterium]|nr:glycosyltransferase family 2 protein [Chloroflexota bacterium]